MPEKMPETKQTICFIINPASGRKKTANIDSLIRKEIDPSRFEVSIYHTHSAGHAATLSSEAVKNQTDIIVAVGGDGTINEVSGQMIGSDSILGIVPRGSGNGLARHLNIPLVPKNALRLINQGYHSSIDTGWINGRHFISLAGVGFDALVAKHFARTRTRGFLTYFNIVANRYLKYRPKKYSLDFKNGMLVNTRALFVTVANSNQFGYNTTIAPNAKLNDGLLDVVIVSKPKLLELPMIANLLLLKRIDQSSSVQIISTPEVVIERRRKRVVNIDGEPVKLEKKLEIKVNPLSLKVIIPKNGQKR
jgi:YegS/Rv2252/BmrU family lipid kinase